MGATMKKAMKAKTAMKAMKKKAKRVSIVARGRGARARVFSGKKVKTSGGLKKSSLMRNKHGRVVSKKAHAGGKTRLQKKIKKKNLKKVKMVPGKATKPKTAAN